MVSESYEVVAVRYGTRQATAADVFLSFPVYGEPDRPLGMDYFFWVARSPSRTVVVDAGFSPAGGAARRRTTLMDMATALRAVGVNPDDVGQVVVTHAHYDHVGGLPAFGAAEVIMTRSEYGFWTGRANSLTLPIERSTCSSPRTSRRIDMPLSYRLVITSPFHCSVWQDRIAGTRRPGRGTRGTAPSPRGRVPR